MFWLQNLVVDVLFSALFLRSVVFWFGDLNFRIDDYDIHVVKSAIENNKLSVLWEKDQVRPLWLSGFCHDWFQPLGEQESEAYQGFLCWPRTCNTRPAHHEWRVQSDTATPPHNNTHCNNRIYCNGCWSLLQFLWSPQESTSSPHFCSELKNGCVVVCKSLHTPRVYNVLHRKLEHDLNIIANNQHFDLIYLL